MKIKEIIHYLEDLFPLDLALEWDNCGIQIGNIDDDVTNVMVALTPDLNVIEECIQSNSNLLITHHPLLINGIKNIDENTYLGKLIFLAIKNGITIYSLHTCLDIGTLESMNKWLFEKLDIDNISNIDEEGLVKKAYVDSTLEQISSLCKDKFNLPFVKVVGDLHKPIKSVAIVGGSGCSYISSLASCVDCLITGDIKYHDAQLALSLGLALIDIGHFSEHVFVEKLCMLIEKQFSVSCLPSLQYDYFTYK